MAQQWRNVPMPSTASAGRALSAANRSMMTAGQLLSSSFEDLSKANTATAAAAKNPELDFATEQITALNSSDQFTEKNRRALLGQLKNADARREANALWDVQKAATLGEEELAKENLRKQGKYEKDLEVSDSEIALRKAQGRQADAGAAAQYASARNSNLQGDRAQLELNQLTETLKENDTGFQILQDAAAKLRTAKTPEERVAVETEMKDRLNTMQLDTTQMTNLDNQWKRLTAPIATHAAEGKAQQTALKQRHEEQLKPLDTAIKANQDILTKAPKASLPEMQQQVVDIYIKHGLASDKADQDTSAFFSNAGAGKDFSMMYPSVLQDVKGVFREGLKTNPLYSGQSDAQREALLNHLETTGVFNGVIVDGLKIGDPTKIGQLPALARAAANRNIGPVIQMLSAQSNLDTLKEQRDQIVREQATDTAALNANQGAAALRNQSPTAYGLPDTGQPRREKEATDALTARYEGFLAQEMQRQVDQKAAADRIKLSKALTMQAQGNSPLRPGANLNRLVKLGKANAFND